MEVGVEVFVNEWADSASEAGVSQSILGHWWQEIVPHHWHVSSDSVGESQFVVLWERGEVVDQDSLSRSWWVGVLLHASVTGGSSTDQDWSSNGWVVNPDDNVLPVVTVTANNVSGRWLILGEICKSKSGGRSKAHGVVESLTPSVHDTVSVSIPSTANIGLTLSHITAAGRDVSGVLETTTKKFVSKEASSKRERRAVFVPSVTSAINSAVWLTTVRNQEERLEFLQVGTQVSTWEGFWPWVDGVVGNDTAGLDGVAFLDGSSLDRGSGGKERDELGAGEMHFELFS